MVVIIFRPVMVTTIQDHPADQISDQTVDQALLSPHNYKGAKK
jgi:hypothetical protein